MALVLKGAGPAVASAMALTLPSGAIHVFWPRVVQRPSGSPALGPSSGQVLGARAGTAVGSIVACYARSRSKVKKKRPKARQGNKTMFPFLGSKPSAIFLFVTFFLSLSLRSPVRVAGFALRTHKVEERLLAGAGNEQTPGCRTVCHKIGEMNCMDSIYIMYLYTCVVCNIINT